VAREQEAAQAQEPAGNQVRTLRFFLIVYIHDTCLKIQDDNAQPPTPPHSSPLRQEGRNVSSSPLPQRCNSSPMAHRCRSHSSSLHLTPSPSPSQVRRTPHPASGHEATSSPTCRPLTASVRLNIPRAEGNAQWRHPIKPPNTMASSSQVSSHQASPPPAMTLTSRTKGKKTAPAGKRRKKNW